MKKRTNEEKVQMINDACVLLNEALETIRNVRKMFHLCGIELCDAFESEPIPGWRSTGSNVQIYKGIKKFETLTETNGYFPCNIIGDGEDTSRRMVKYKNIVFLQVGEERTSTKAKFTFR